MMNQDVVFGRYFDHPKGVKIAQDVGDIPCDALA